MEYRYVLKGLSCPHCASQIEAAAERLDGVRSSALNFATSTLSIVTDAVMPQIGETIQEIVRRYEPDVDVILHRSAPGAAYEGNGCPVLQATGKDRESELGRMGHSGLKHAPQDDHAGANKEEACAYGCGVASGIRRLGRGTDADRQSKGGAERENRIKLARLLVGLVLFAGALAASGSYVLRLALYLSAYFFFGADILYYAGKNLLRGRFLDENFLMGIATVGAFAIGEYPEAVAVMLFYQTGEFFQDMAVARSRRSIAALMDIRPDYANLMTANEERLVSPEEVQVDDIIVVKPGEKIPLDGIVAKGASMIDTSALTGESVPKNAGEGDTVISGCINQTGVLYVRVTKPFAQSTVSKVLELTQSAAAKKAPTEKFITRFSRYYTPAVVALAAAIALVPPVFLGDFAGWLQRGLVFLVISCPCALVISIPLGFFGGIGAASANGILVKGGNYLEALCNVETAVFDKTGTLTKGAFEVERIYEAQSFTSEEVIHAAAYAESYSSHPIALSIRKAYGKQIDKDRIEGYEELSGHGVRAKVLGREILCGNDRLMRENGIEISSSQQAGTKVYVAIDGKYAGCLIITDQIKEDSAAAIARLKALGVRKTVMLTGDNAEAGRAAANAVGVDEAYFSLLPHQKVEKLEELDSRKSKNGKLLFVGDGINDAPVLARSDIGVAMGALGSDAAIEAADVVLMTDEPGKLPQAIEIAKFTRKIVRENIAFALGIKGIVLLLGALGFASLWAAVFADVGVAMIAVMNAMRVLRHKPVSIRQYGYSIKTE